MTDVAIFGPPDTDDTTVTQTDMEVHTEDLRPLLYLRNLLNDLFEKPEKYKVTAEEVPQLQAAAAVINEILHRVKRHV